jgi:hypothetical protein
LEKMAHSLSNAGEWTYSSNTRKLHESLDQHRRRSINLTCDGFRHYAQRVVDRGKGNINVLCDIEIGTFGSDRKDRSCVVSRNYWKQKGEYKG